jgi:hypothetical protein
MLVAECWVGRHPAGCVLHSVLVLASSRGALGCWHEAYRCILPPLQLQLSGTLVACSIPVVGFNAVLMSEHFGAFFATAVIHGALLVSRPRLVSCFAAVVQALCMAWVAVSPAA